MLQALLDLKDCVGEKRAARRVELENLIDCILDGNVPFPDVELDDTELLQTPIDVYALTVFGGYIARKVRGMKPASVCDVCYASLTLTDIDSPRERESLLELRSRGGLLRPTDELFQLIFKVSI